MVSPRNHEMMTLDELMQGYTDMTLPQIEVKGISADSQWVKPGDVFIALSGLSRHAIDYVDDAVKAGAGDYLTYPLDVEELKLVSENLNKTRIMQSELNYLRDQF